MGPRTNVAGLLRPLGEIALVGPAKRLAFPFIPEGQVSLLFGMGGTGKSYLALALAMSIASGKEILPGVPPLCEADVAVLDWEAQQPQWRHRAELLAAGAGIAVPERLHYAPLHEHEIEGLDFRDFAEGLGDLRLIVIDSVEAALGSSALGADPSDRIRGMWKVVRRLGVAVLLVDHRSKTEGVRPSPYGSVFKQNWARDVWGVDGQLGVDTVTLSHIKSNDIAIQPDLAFRAAFDDARSVRFERAGAAPRTKSDELVQYLESRVDGIASMDEVLERFPGSVENVRKMASRSNGRVRTRSGQVMLVTP